MFWPWRSIFKQFLHCTIFSWNITSESLAHCEARGINDPLCCFVGLTSSPDCRTDCSETLVVHLTVNWTPQIVTFLTEAASHPRPKAGLFRFWLAFWLYSHLEAALDQELQGVLTGSSMASVLLHNSMAASASHPAYTQLFQPEWIPANEDRLREGTAFI